MEIVALVKYKKITNICKSMSSAVQFLTKYKTNNFSENVDLAKNAILSLQFHKNLNFLETVVEVFAKKTPSDILEDNLRKKVTGITRIYIKIATTTCSVTIYRHHCIAS